MKHEIRGAGFYKYRAELLHFLYLFVTCFNIFCCCGLGTLNVRRLPKHDLCIYRCKESK